MSRRRKPDKAKQGSPAWMSTYGDLVTLLLCFFVLLFSMSNIDIAKFKAALSSFVDNQIDVMPGGEAITDGDLISNGISQLNGVEQVFDSKIPMEQEGEESKEIQKKIDEAKKRANDIKSYLEDKGLDSVVDIEYNSQIIKLTLQGELLFDSGKAELKTEALDLIDIIARMLIENVYTDKTIQIEGHTDNLPISNQKYESNWQLSTARANVVGERLIHEHNINPAKIALAGYGEYRPLAVNTTKEGRAKNRRVEIKIIMEEYENTQDFEELSE